MIDIKGDQFFDNDILNDNIYNIERSKARNKCIEDNNIKLIRRNDIKPIINYITNKYGSKYLKSFKRKKTMKVALIADCHFGVKKSDIPFMESQIRFYKNQFVPELKQSNIKDIFILGDVFDTRQTINVQTINIVIDLFKNILKDFNINIIVGNHDMYMTTTTDINSLKILDILPNVTVYEKQTILNIDNKTILLQPWITDYSTYNLTGHYDYAFMHADIIGFDQGGGRLSEAGLIAKELLKHIDYVYSGHYHNGVHREFEPGKCITYLGAPYQLTRIDRDGIRGYHILDIKTGNRSLIENKVSMKFTRHVYPNADLNIIPGNVVDLDVPYEYADQTKKISTYVAKLDALKPAYPVNINILPSPDTEEEEFDTDNLNIISLFKNYLDQLETKVDKNDLYDNFIELYNIYKEQA